MSKSTPRWFSELKRRSIRWSNKTHASGSYIWPTLKLNEFESEDDFSQSVYTTSLVWPGSVLTHTPLLLLHGLMHHDLSKNKIVRLHFVRCIYILAIQEVVLLRSKIVRSKQRTAVTVFAVKSLSHCAL